jgi:hypothetical protein
MLTVHEAVQVAGTPPQRDVQPSVKGGRDRLQQPERHPIAVATLDQGDRGLGTRSERGHVSLPEPLASPERPQLPTHPDEIT